MNLHTLFIGDEVRFMPKDSTASIIATVSYINHKNKTVTAKSDYHQLTTTIYHDRIQAVFPKFQKQPD